MKRTLVTVFAGVILLYGCVVQEDLYSIDDRLQALEQNRDDLARRIETQEKKNREQLKSYLDEFRESQTESSSKFRDQSADMHVMLGQLREEIRRLKGGLEEASHLLNQRIKVSEKSEEKRFGRLESLQESSRKNKERLLRIEQYLNLEASQKPKTKAIPDRLPKKVLPENELYKAAKYAFDKGDFDTARQGFQKLITSYSKSTNADNAQFWIGETYYREKWYEKAILEYQKVIENYPKGNKVQASLLKQGFAFLNIGDKVNSRLILKELINKYPKSNEAKIAKQKLK